MDDEEYAIPQRTMTPREYAAGVLQRSLVEANKMRRERGHLAIQEQFRIGVALAPFTEPFHVLWVNNKHGYVAISENWVIFEDVVCDRLGMKRIQV